MRVDFPIAWTAPQLERTIDGYAARGIRVAPLASFNGKMPSTHRKPQASPRGPRPTAPAARSGRTPRTARLAIQDIEFGNETSDGYQYGDHAGTTSYRERAENYARSA